MTSDNPETDDRFDDSDGLEFRYRLPDGRWSEPRPVPPDGIIRSEEGTEFDIRAPAFVEEDEPEEFTQEDVEAARLAARAIFDPGDIWQKGHEPTPAELEARLIDLARRIAERLPPKEEVA